MIALSLAACGGDSKKSPDASPQGDAKTIDAQNCDQGTVGTFDFQGPFQASPPFATWDAPINGVGGGSALDYQIQLYGGIESNLQGMFDLSMGNQSNFSTCAICIVAFSTDNDADGHPKRAFFQKSGSITLSQDPLASSHLMGSITNLELQEVTINWPTQTNQMGDYSSTPVANGACGSVASEQLDHDGVPNAYTCAHTGWLDGTTCDCNCGAEDPDCYSGSNAVPACTTGQICKASACVTGPANDVCTAAIPLTVGTPVTGTTAGAHNDYDMGLETATCTKGSQPGSDVAYVVTLTAATQYTIALTNVDAAYDASVALVGPGAATVCGATITTCVGGADNLFEGGDESFTYTPTMTGTYYVIVDSALQPGVEGGAFTLTVSAM